jgi:dolichyl-phosphate beta-glucosyltransferase
LNAPTLSVIIPAYNEAARIGQTLIDLDRYLREHQISSEIIVVDDGSRDDTVKVVQELNLPRLRVVLNECNRGKGFSVRHGFRQSGGRYTLFMDADGATSMEEIGKFIELMPQGYDLLFASRYLKESVLPVPQGRWRNITALVFRKAVRLLFRFPYRDTQCGFKMFSPRAVQTILQHSKEDGFVFDIEFLYWARKANLKIREVAVTWTDQKGSSVGFISGPLKMSWRILSLRIRNLLQ